jgi:tetratricopeptide (TPR) repeat protein
MPYDAGLFALVASTVNLHHFVLDGAIWKLRDGRIARILLRRDEAAAPAPVLAPPSRRGWARGGVWATGALCAALVVLGSLESEFGFRRAAARGDEARVAEAARRLGWMGRDGPEIHARLAEFAAARGDWEGALRRTARGAALGRDPAPLVALGVRAESEGETASAVAAYELALGVDPDCVPALHRAGLALLARGERVRARELLERASRLAPRDPAIEASLERARG